MKRWGGFWTVGWVLFGLLAISMAMILLGREEFATDPSTNSYGPSGTRAFAELLRSRGYEVEVSLASRPATKPEDLGVGFMVEDRETEFDFSAPGHQSPTQAQFIKHLEGGGRGLLIRMPPNFLTATTSAQVNSREVIPAVGDQSLDARFEVSEGMALDVWGQDRFLSADADFAAYTDSHDEPVLRFLSYGKGLLGALYDGTGATNRFLDQKQNAAFLLNVVRALKPEGGRIIVFEGLHRDVGAPGLLETIGPWALAAWYQVIFLALVVVFTLGKRFGLPEVFRGRQRGGRELLDAYADLLGRSRKPELALRKIVADADREIRNRYGIASDLSPKLRNERIPPDLANALLRAEVSIAPELSDGAALSVARDLEREMAKAMPQRAHRRRRKAR